MTKVQWQFSASLDGFIAGPGHDMSFLAASGAHQDLSGHALAQRTGALLMGNRTFRGDDPEGLPLEGEAYGGGWSGQQFVLTPHPVDVPGYTMVDDLADGVARAVAAAGDLDVGVLGADVGRQCLEAGLLDEVYVGFVHVLLGDGTRMYDVAGGALRRLELVELHHGPGSTNLLFRVPRD